ncbi:MAG: DUF86 domain-containing protein [Candidatus Njordarchaeota archaeon]
MDALSFLEKYRDISPDMLKKDKKLLGSILWYLYTVVQGTIDLGLKVISKLKLETPESYVDVFRVLMEEGILPEDLSQELVKMAKFRHILAHVYFKLNLNIICEIIREELVNIKRYLNVIAKTLAERGIEIDEL